MDFNNQSQRRYNPLTGEWVLVSPHRAKRPWQGKQEKVVEKNKTVHDPNCYLCAGNTRANGEINEQYTGTYVFDNDFAALTSAQTDKEVITSEDGLFQTESVAGKCRVMCFSPNHSLTLASMPVEAIEKVVETWQKEYESLGKLAHINYVQIFENKGEIMGCSNPHPHGQIWATDTIPDEVSKEQKQQKLYFEKHGRTLLSDYLATELEKKERIIFENDDFVVLIPFWAVWPFETMIMPKKAIQHINQLNKEMVKNYAEAISVLCSAYDNIFDVSFPYSSGIHQQPTDGKEYPEWHFHMHFYPPLLRSASVKKFMVGYEMLANPQRDITAEQSAEMIRNAMK